MFILSIFHFSAILGSNAQNIPVHNKVKHFILRDCVNAIPTREQLWRRNCSPSPASPCCLNHSENVEHLLLLCAGSKAVWFCGPLSIKVDELHVRRFDEWCYGLFSNLDFSDFSKGLIVITCWFICKSRCSLIFDNQPFCPVNTLMLASKELDSFWAANGWCSQPISADALKRLARLFGQLLKVISSKSTWMGLTVLLELLELE